MDIYLHAVGCALGLLTLGGLAAYVCYLIRKYKEEG